MALVDLDNSNFVITSLDLTRSPANASPANLPYPQEWHWGTLTIPTVAYTGLTGHRLGFRINASYSGYQEVDNLVVTSSIPEPSALSLLGLFGGAFLLRRRNK